MSDIRTPSAYYSNGAQDALRCLAASFDNAGMELAASITRRALLVVQNGSGLADDDVAAIGRLAAEAVPPLPSPTEQNRGPASTNPVWLPDGSGTTRPSGKWPHITGSTDDR